MKTYPLNLTLIIEESPQRMVNSRTGEQYVDTVLEVVRNDAGVLFDLLSGVNTAKSEYSNQRRKISAIKRELRPLRRIADATLTRGTHDVGTIEITGDVAELILKLCDKPPEGFQFMGATSDTLVELEDALEPIKKQWSEEGSPKEAEKRDAPPVGKEA